MAEAIVAIIAGSPIQKKRSPSSIVITQFHVHVYTVTHKSHLYRYFIGILFVFILNDILEAVVLRQEKGLIK